VAVLLPTLTSARETARRVICASNLHQWGVTINSYSLDCAGWYPGITAWGANDIFSDSSITPTPVNTPEQAYKKWMVSYGFALATTRCPSRTQTRWSWSNSYASSWFATDYFHFFGRGDRNLADSLYYYGWTSSYYAWNGLGNSQNRCPVPNVLKFRRSSRTVLAYDRSWTPVNVGYYYDQGNFDEESNHANQRGAGNPYIWSGNTYVLKYADGSNYLLLDGSVTWSDLRTAGSIYAIGGKDYYRTWVAGANLRTP
jgi:hypothetical protein